MIFDENQAKISITEEFTQKLKVKSPKTSNFRQIHLPPKPEKRPKNKPVYLDWYEAKTHCCNEHPNQDDNFLCSQTHLVNKAHLDGV